MPRRARQPHHPSRRTRANGNRRPPGSLGRLTAWGIAAALVIGVMGWGVVRWRRAEAAARIPPPPRLSSPSSAIATHLVAKYTAARADPTSAASVGSLCVAYHADMFFDAADQCYELATALAPDDWRWPYYRALIQFDRGGGDALVASLRRVVAGVEHFAPAWLRLGDTLFKARDYEAARDAWQRASELQGNGPAATPSPRHVPDVPLSAFAALGLARVALVRGESDRAREILERVVAETPQFSSALRLLADSYRALGRHADADRLVYRANRLPPYAPYVDPMVDDLARESRNSVFLLRLASEANLATNAEWSEYLTRRALQFDPDNPEVVVKLGRILRTIGRNEEALGLFQRYHGMVPGDYLGLAHVGSCLSALGRYEEAESYIRRALTGIDDALTHYNLGLLLSVTGRLGEAVTEYEKALAKEPMHVDARTNLAAALTRQGKLGPAARELTRVLDQDPENAVARTNLGVVRLQQGRVEQARTELEAALRSDPRLEQARQALESIGRSPAP